jgi:arabinofuranan 3-O-arabinosyltransferase
VLPRSATFDVDLDIRLDPDATDELLHALLGDPGLSAAANRRLPGDVTHGGPATVDGDTSTSWITPVDQALGATLTVRGGDAVIETSTPGSLMIAQPAGDFSPITEMTITTASGMHTVAVPAPDAQGRSAVPLPAGPIGDEMSLTITGIEPRLTVDRRFGDRFALPSAIADLGLVDSTASTAVGIIDSKCRTDLLEVDGVAVGIGFQTTRDVLLAGESVRARLCAPPLVLTSGEHTIASVGRSRTGFSVDRVVLRPVDGLDGAAATDSPAAAGTATVAVTDNSARHREVTVGACPSGCWLVLGEGFNTSWAASLDGTDLGTPELVDGGFNGWWLEPAESSRSIVFDWTAQRPVTIGIMIALATAATSILLLVAALLLTGRLPNESDPARPVFGLLEESARPSTWHIASLPILAIVLIGPLWLLPGIGTALATFVASRWRHRRSGLIAPAIALGCVAAVTAGVLVIERFRQLPPDAGWTTNFSAFHGLSVFAVLTLAWSSCAPDLSWRGRTRTAVGSRTAADEPSR